MSKINASDKIILENQMKKKNKQTKDIFKYNFHLKIV